MDKELLQKRRILERQSRQGLDYVGPHRRPDTLKDALVDDRQKILAATNLARQQQRMSGGYTQIRPIISGGGGGLNFIEQTTFNLVKYHDQGTVFQNTAGPARHSMYLVPDPPFPDDYLPEAGYDLVFCHFDQPWIRADNTFPTNNFGLILQIYFMVEYESFVLYGNPTANSGIEGRFFFKYVGTDWDPTTLTWLNMPSLTGNLTFLETAVSTQYSPLTAATFIDDTTNPNPEISKTVLLSDNSFNAPATVYGVALYPAVDFVTNPNCAGYIQLTSINNVKVAMK